MRDLSRVRVVVDTALNTGRAEYQNYGDIAMLQVAVDRLRKLWPSAIIEVITESDENLVKYCPTAKPLSRFGRDLWIGESFLFGRVYQYFPKIFVQTLSWCSHFLERNFPKLLRYIVRLRFFIKDDDNLCGNLMNFLKAMENADLFVVCGAGGFSDTCIEWNMKTLKTLETAILRKVPFVMMGQAMGPLNDCMTLQKAKEILPFAALITLRGGRGSKALLSSLGVDASKVLTTGDEAVELAYEARTSQMGKGLGINLRVAPYAGVGKDFIEKLRPVLQQFARQHNAPMIPVPIAVHNYAADHHTIKQLLAGFDDKSDGGLAFDAPMKVIKQIRLCRIVVTGAYHAAIFALAQGIPVVCLSKSPYYDAKFHGLEDHFEQGCETVSLDSPDLSEQLNAAMERAWRSAEIVRLPLQQAALHQIELSRNAYALLSGLLKFR
jgi:polysaccharide pyruvyl transferase WcaK-like protein